MPIETIKIDVSVEWKELKNGKGTSYTLGDNKNPSIDSNWYNINVIYRWIKRSNKEVAYIGETDRVLTERVNNYTSAKTDSSAGITNKKIYSENNKLQQNNDGLTLEFIDKIPGYNLKDQRERRFAECLLQAYYRPYLQ